MTDTRKVVESWWYACWFGQVGIVKTIDAEGNSKHYIGTVPQGGTQQEDEHKIMVTGCRFVSGSINTENDAP